uniref:HMA domain-containing protein n=2 Tax=Fagus sylvatica TaxID=28930 RepID=A0A2N9FQK4_FAGSY
MKQKIVMKVQMNCEKSRTKAMKIAAVEEGVTSVAIEGADKSQVVVKGDGVDAACLTRSLRKKLGHATIVSVQELKEDAKKKPEEKGPTPTLCCTQYPQRYPMYCTAVSDPYPSNNCTIL